MKHFNLEVATPIVADGMVLYCDGSSRPNPGFIGAGIHGYAYNLEAPTKGTGLGTHTLSAFGYSDNKETPKEKVVAVTPLLYYNTAASFDFQTTNNVAELLAAHVAIRIALACKVKSLLLKTDSEYVVKVLTKFAAMWVLSNWTKRDGTQVSNQEFIKDLLISINELAENNIKLDVQWVKGHSTHIGNNAADKLANIGSEMSRNRKVMVDIQEHPAAGYWKQDNSRHPFLSHRRAYISASPESVTPEGIYFLGDHGKEDEFVGRGEVDGALAVTFLKEKEPVIDTIVEYCKTLSGQDDRFFFVKLDSVFAQNRNKDVEHFKESSLIVDHEVKRLDLLSGDNTMLVRDLQPFRLSERTFEALANLTEKLTAYIAGTSIARSVITDITSTFYGKTKLIVKNKETINTELHKKYVVGYRSEKVKIKHEKGENEIILTLGIDIPDRNALKRLEATVEKMVILSWMESDQCVRHACIIQTTTGDYSIWCGYYSNQLYVE
jgi:ribonuclease HI